MQGRFVRITDFFKSHRLTLLVWVPIALYYFRFIKRPDGMTQFPQAANCFLIGKPLAFCAGSFTYPPAFAFLMIPFVFMPMWLRNIVWYVLSIAALYFGFRMSEHLVMKTFRIRFEKDQLYRFRFLSVLFGLKFVFAVLENQAYDCLIFFLLVLGVYGLAEENDFLAASAIALAAAIKATPLLFFPYLLFRKKWKVFSFCMVFFLAISFLPDLFFSAEGQSTYFGRWFQDTVAPSLFSSGNASSLHFWEGENQLNQSLRSFIYRLAARGEIASHFREVLYIIYALFLFLLSYLIFEFSKMELPYALDGSVLMIGMLMLSPMSSKSHFVVLILPYMVIWGYLFRSNRLNLKTPIGFILMASFAFNSLTSRGIIGDRLSTILLLSGCVTIGTLLILAVLGLVIFELRRDRLGAVDSAGAF